MPALRLPLTGLLTALLLAVGCGEAEKNHQPPRQTADRLPQQPAEQDNPAEGVLPPHLVHPPRDPRSAVAKALEEGLLAGDGSDNDKLRALLRVAGVPEASQVLVFSKTSLQDRLIAPKRPRAIYFNDDCYIGTVPGGVFEYGDADADPAVGCGLFALNPDDGATARLTSNSTCLNCHGGSRTNNRPGFLIRSVFADEEGFPITSAGSELVGHHTPIEKRWGGWYVTGQSGETHHRGNQTATPKPNGDAELELEKGSNLSDLSPYFNTKRYLRPTSDIVALMVLEHQVEMHNLLTQGASVVHEQTERSRSLAKHLGEAFDPANYQTLQHVIASHAQRIVKHLLFSEEVALTEPIVGDPAFQEAFRANRREDSEGRSLKDFDLKTRMFKHRCSYMVYSRAFDLMPDLLKNAVIEELHGALAYDNDNEAYAHLHPEEQQVISTILSETTDWFDAQAQAQ